MPKQILLSASCPLPAFTGTLGCCVAIQTSASNRQIRARLRARTVVRFTKSRARLTMSLLTVSSPEAAPRKRQLLHPTYQLSTPRFGSAGHPKNPNDSAKNREILLPRMYSPTFCRKTVENRSQLLRLVVHLPIHCAIRVVEHSLFALSSRSAACIHDRRIHLKSHSAECLFNPLLS